MSQTGVLLVSFGGADSIEAVEPFMRSVMGRAPTDDEIAAVRRKYLTIGGGSPLPIVVERMACALERELSGLAPEPPRDPEGVGGIGTFTEPGERALEGVTVPVEIGMLHWRPAIVEGVARLVDRGCRQVVWVSLSPLESAATTQAFRAAVKEACDEFGVEAVESDSYLDSPVYASLLASLGNTARGLLEGYTPVVAFTAHSLPVEESGNGGYATQLEGLASRVAETMGLGAPDPAALEESVGLKAFGGPGTSTPWLLAYQSRGKRPGAWLGPDLAEVIEAVEKGGWDSVCVCPIGFVLDHLETLYDLDVEAADAALTRGLEFSRAKGPNDDRAMIGIVANAIRRHL